jgi:hypothetical protein
MDTATALDDVIARATELAVRGVAPGDAADDLLAAAGGDRRSVEAARDRVAARIRARVDDFEATATLQLLNRVLSRLPIDDPLDWRVRWTQRFRKP